MVLFVFVFSRIKVLTSRQCGFVKPMEPLSETLEHTCQWTGDADCFDELSDVMSTDETETGQQLPSSDEIQLEAEDLTEIVDTQSGAVTSDTREPTNEENDSQGVDNEGVF